MHRWGVGVIVAMVWITAAAGSAHAQYFGQNKVRNKALNFEVLRTQHFDIYFYPAERDAAAQVGRLAERWYTRDTGLLNHVLTTRQPIILYASHTDFEQSPVVPGMIQEGTGGVTLSLGRKVVLPLTGTLAETDHVLGHELIHAYQYDMTTTRGSPEPGAARLPLWFVEGMAEYLSLGPEDAHTAMWLRDAIARDRMPTIKDLNNPNKYSPYRFGQAFWAFVGGRYGDDKIGPLLLAAARHDDLNTAFEDILHVSEKQLSEEWKLAALASNRPVLDATRPVPAADVLVAGRKNEGGLNVSPAISPDGQWMMFFSERGLFSIELYLANARTGQIVRKITSTAISAHFNNLEFINSAGGWAADSRRFAFGHVEASKASISIYDVSQQRVVRHYPIPGVGEIFSPTWSPDGREIAFTAIADGFTDLYLLNLNSGAVRPLTHDSFAELEPAWSPDGSRIAFVTDRFTTNLADLSHGQYRLGLLDIKSGALTPIPAGGGNQTNPQWSPDGSSLFFLSDTSGITNIYRLDLTGGARPVQMTNLQTGVSGITALSPAFSVAQRAGAIVYSSFRDNSYSLVRLPAASPPAAAATALAALHPALLPPRTADTGAVASYLRNWTQGLALAAGFTTHPYHPGLQLEYVAPPSIAVGVSSFGTQLGGGTALVFGDILAYHNLTVAVQSLSYTGGQGFVRNLGGQAVYLNERHRWSWGVGGGQTPYVTGSYAVAAGVVNGVPVAQEQTVTQWELDRQVVGLLAYPFSRAQRLEFTAGYENIGYALQSEVDTTDLTTGTVVGIQRSDLPSPPGLNFGLGTAALVYDTSLFGGVGPVLGQSYRLQAGVNAGSIDFGTALVDYRKYLSLARPVSLAGRFLHFGRYGSGADDQRLQPLYLGYPTIVRGYDFNSIQPAECGPQFQATGACPLLNRLLGSKIVAVNLEMRFELLGPLGILRTPYVPPVEVAPFFDAGVAWTSADKPNFLGGAQHPVSSEGIVLRGNLLGFAVVSVDFALPNNRPLRSHVWEFSFQPGF